MAQMRSADRIQKCLLFGVDRTYRRHVLNDALDPKRTSIRLRHSILNTEDFGFTEDLALGVPMQPLVCGGPAPRAKRVMLDRSVGLRLTRKRGQVRGSVANAHYARCAR